jgi:hypothetical protein
MGGTTAKVGLIQHGKPNVTHDFTVGTSVSAEVRASGEPIKIPVIDLAEVGAGGGSIAWIDPGGLLQVGPLSAGAAPGPACYGLGGTQPTVTDANVVLGYLNPDYFLGGKMKIYPERSHDAIARNIGERLNLDPVLAAHGIYQLANNPHGRCGQIDHRVARHRSARIRGDGVWRRRPDSYRQGRRTVQHPDGDRTAVARCGFRVRPADVRPRPRQRDHAYRAMQGCQGGGPAPNFS